MTDGPTQFKQGQRATWSAGKWDEFADHIAPAGAALLETLEVGEGERLLDIGTGSGGSIAIPAALRGADVVGSDLTPELFDDARRRASAAGVEIEWAEADAEALPFGDESFDVVTSTFGHMFAPRHAVAASEMTRVLKRGGRLGFASWLPESTPYQNFKLMGSIMPPPPEGVEPPVIWGHEDHVREMLEPHGIELEFHDGVCDWLVDDIEEFNNRTEEIVGPLVMAKAALGERWPEVREQIHAIQDRYTEPNGDGYRIRNEYLITIGRKPA